VPLDVDATTVRGTWLRHIPHGFAPDSRPRVLADGRWHRARSGDALYLANDEPGMWAEWYRHLAEAGIPPQHALPRDLWRFELSRIRVANLGTAPRLSRVGLPLPRPGRRNWPPYKAIGEQLRADGWSGLVAPSAARPRSKVLCLFIPRKSTFPPEVEPRPPAEIIDARRWCRRVSGPEDHGLAGGERDGSRHHGVARTGSRASGVAGAGRARLLSSAPGRAWRAHGPTTAESAKRCAARAWHAPVARRAASPELAERGH
jgi:hypothetical protein